VESIWWVQIGVGEAERRTTVVEGGGGGADGCAGCVRRWQISTGAPQSRLGLGGVE
jgi:hypothetical protein